MPYKVKTGTILIKQDALLPQDLRIGTFFCLAAETKATVFGIDSQNMVRRAVERILDRTKAEMFNSLEVTRVSSIGSERFPLVRHVTVSARLRHIQESFVLSCADHVRKWDVDAKLRRAQRGEWYGVPDGNLPSQEATSGEATGHVAVLGA
jgi:hypothetical protein